MERFDIIIVGAGPAGLACSLEARRLGLSSIILEKGTIVNTVVGFPTYMTFFSTSELLELGEMPFSSVDIRPTRLEAINYYRGVARKGGLNMSLHNEVTGATKNPDGTITVTATKGAYTGEFVVLATGYFDQTNRLGVQGENLPKVHHYYKEPFEYVDTQALVIGGRNSAVEAALDLYRNGVHVTMIHRQDSFARSIKYWIRPDIENRIAAGQIQVKFNTEVTEIRERSVLLKNNVTGELSEIANDVVFPLIGYRPSTGLFRIFQIEFDAESLVPTYDPTTLATNAPNVFIAGSVACGCKTWEIFIENGRQHAISVIGEIARRFRGE